jgi:hypothetical protein
MKKRSTKKKKKKKSRNPNDIQYDAIALSDEDMVKGHPCSYIPRVYKYIKRNKEREREREREREWSTCIVRFISDISVA